MKTQWGEKKVMKSVQKSCHLPEANFQISLEG